MTAKRRIVLWSSALALGAAALAAGCGSLDSIQRELIFRPVTEEWASSGRAGLEPEELWIPIGASGERLHAWWIPAEGKGKGTATQTSTVLYLHGARVNLSGSVYRIRSLSETGYNVLAVDYRGFGRSSPARPSEDSVYEDALAAWRYLRTRVPEARRRILYGHSLGGAIAADLATRVDDGAGVVLESTFTSILELADRGLWGLLPLDALLTQRFDVLERMPRLRMPVLIVQGAEDSLVPPAMAWRLHAAAPEPKRLLMVQGAGHRFVGWRAGEAFRQALAQLGVVPR
jgi:pimeloyl-ACP methyl ester carboxylesterase